MASAKNTSAYLKFARRITEFICLYLSIRLAAYLLPMLFDKKTLHLQKFDVELGVFCLVAIYAFVIGIHAATRNDPMRNPSYRDWLRQTPWRPGEPPPLGNFGPRPIHAIYLLLLAMAMYTLIQHLIIAIPIPFVFYGIGYILWQIAFLFTSQRYAAKYLIFFLIGCLFYIPMLPFTIPAILCVVFILLFIAQKRAVLHWYKNPTPDECGTNNHASDIDDEEFSEGEAETGPQFLQAHDCQAPELPAGWVIARSFLFTWYITGIAFCIEYIEGLSGGAPTQNPVFYWACFILPTLLAAIRWVLYARFGGPPIPLFARLKCGVGWIPRYDNKFIAPASMLFIAAVTILPGIFLDINKMFYLPIAALAMSLLMGFCPPSLKSYRLTGRYQMMNPSNKPITA